ncbi:hypothetical protein Mext_3133 [Methylorubrum extorquens PA1]|nr:hypothetical protein Mext_3133 [Methylorubrum extorquens PA1]
MLMETPSEAEASSVTAVTGSAADCGEATREAAPSKRCMAALRPAELVDTAETMNHPPCAPAAQHEKGKGRPQRLDRIARHSHFAAGLRHRPHGREDKVSR